MEKIKKKEEHKKYSKTIAVIGLIPAKQHRDFEKFIWYRRQRLSDEKLSALLTLYKCVREETLHDQLKGEENSEKISLRVIWKFNHHLFRKSLSKKSEGYIRKLLSDLCDLALEYFAVSPVFREQYLGSLLLTGMPAGIGENSPVFEFVMDKVSSGLKNPRGFFLNSVLKLRIQEEKINHHTKTRTHRPDVGTILDEFSQLTVAKSLELYCNWLMEQKAFGKDGSVPFYDMHFEWAAQNTAILTTAGSMYFQGLQLLKAESPDAPAIQRMMQFLRENQAEISPEHKLRAYTILINSCIIWMQQPGGTDIQTLRDIYRESYSDKKTAALINASPWHLSNYLRLIARAGFSGTGHKKISEQGDAIHSYLSMFSPRKRKYFNEYILGTTYFARDEWQPAYHCFERVLAFNEKDIYLRLNAIKYQIFCMFGSGKKGIVDLREFPKRGRKEKEPDRIGAVTMDTLFDRLRKTLEDHKDIHPILHSYYSGLLSVFRKLDKFLNGRRSKSDGFKKSLLADIEKIPSAEDRNWLLQKLS